MERQCIDNQYWTYALTVNKKYTIWYQEDGYYWIVCDDGVGRYFHAMRFKEEEEDVTTERGDA